MEVIGLGTSLPPMPRVTQCSRLGQQTQAGVDPSCSIRNGGTQWTRYSFRVGSYSPRVPQSDSSTIWLGAFPLGPLLLLLGVVLAALLSWAMTWALRPLL